jgi:CopG family nickel-responsive transcriptional regulator
VKEKKPGANPVQAEEELSRLGVSVPASLLTRFDELITRKGYASRSEAYRDLMRDALIEEFTSVPSQPVIGTLTLVYNHHVRQVNDRLVDMQHSHHDQIVSTIHVHLDHDNCLEVLILKGEAGEVRRVAEALIATKGVRHGKLTLTTASEVGKIWRTNAASSARVKQ